MHKNKYFLLLKTGDAELRSLENYKEAKEHIFPIIEITRGRKSKYDSIGLIEKRLDKVKNIFKNTDVCLDLTTSYDLSNSEIDNLFSYSDGYRSWIEFVNNINNEMAFKSITPTILVDTNDPDLKNNLRLQVQELSTRYSTISYRNNIQDDGCYDDLENIKDIIAKENPSLLFILDCEYIAPGVWTHFANKIVVRIREILKIIPTIKFIIVSTSFPKFVSDIGNDETDTFHLNEIEIYREVINQIKTNDIYYGDYGSINPERNDQIIMSRGWVPRIDVPLASEIFYYRQKRGANEYSEVYSELARNYIMQDVRFPHNLSNNWGIEQIELSADGFNPGSSPSFWISVRMNIHIQQQLKRLGYL